MAFLTFMRAEEGAITLDWVALGAGILIIGVTTLGVISNGVDAVAQQVSAGLSRATAVELPIAGEGGAADGRDGTAAGETAEGTAGAESPPAIVEDVAGDGADDRAPMTLTRGPRGGLPPLTKNAPLRLDLR